MPKKAKTTRRPTPAKKTTEVIKDAAAKIVEAIIPDMNTKEKCLRCGSIKFSVSNDFLNTRYCSCGNIWKPKSAEQILVDELKAERIKTRDVVAAIKVQVEGLLEVLITGEIDYDNLEMDLLDIKLKLENLL